MGKTVVYLQKSDKKDKKFKVTIVKPDSKNKTIYFGASGYSDFTKHKDKKRMERYDSRHKPRENWTKSGITTAGFWSKWILWSKPSLAAAKAYTAKKFNITIKSGKPPDNTMSKSYKKSPKHISQHKSKKSHMGSIDNKVNPKTNVKIIRRKSPKLKSKAIRQKPKTKAKTIRRKSPKLKNKSNRRKSKAKTIRRKSPKLKSKSKHTKSVKINKRPFNKGIWYVITKEGCKHCDNTKKLLHEKNIEADIEVINDANKLVIYEEIDNITDNYRYFPMIFYNGKFIGGYTELQKHNF